MKILAIRGKNLASLEGEFEIDFNKEPLKSAGIFAITGSTGAGKSTILDAISLALYAEVPRLMNASSKREGEEELTPRDARRILRRGKGEGYAEVDFEAMNGQVYRSRWEVHRAGIRPDGKMQGEQISVMELREEMPLQGNNSELKKQLEQLIGLSFEQFRRTILLAQGDFAAFLKAEESEKTELLEKMTGTDIYRRISKRIYERQKEEKNKIENIQQLMSQIEVLSDEVRLEKEKLQRDIEPQKKTFEKQKETYKEQLKWFEEKADRENSLEVKKRELKEVQKTYDDAESIRVELMEIEHVQPILGAYNEKKEKEKELRVNKGKRERWEQLQKSLCEDLVSIGTKIQGAIKQVEHAEKEINDSQPLLTEARRLDGEINRTKKEIEKLQQQLKRKYSEQLAEKKKALRALRNNEQKFEKEAEKLQHSVSAELSRLRAELIDGEPCPLCGALHHPAAGKEAPIAEVEERNKVVSKLKALREQVEQIREEIGRLEVLVKQEETAKQDLNEHKKSLAEFTVQRNKYFKGRDVEVVISEQNNALKSAQNKLNNLKEEKSSKELEEKDVSVRLDENIKQSKILENALNSATQTIDDFIANSEVVLNDEKLEQLFSHDATWMKDKREYLKQLNHKLLKTKSAVEERQKVLQEHLESKDKPQAELDKDSVIEQLKEVEQRIEQLNNEDKNLSNALAQDETNRKKLENFKKDIQDREPQVKLWAQLNDLFGSASGDKFAKIAQRYTISNLLGYANKQLETIAPRYRLKQVDPDSLNLVVVDRYMMNEERTVFSLSGGETFLVSLALALGLSALSSRHVNIRSLFIDEGFGSLDADTLSVALDALETLQSQQSRVIGVISHVQEMNERISTQVQVKSNGSGGSTIAIRS